jgi:hypothetical protein
MVHKHKEALRVHLHGSRKMTDASCEALQNHGPVVVPRQQVDEDDDQRLAPAEHTDSLVATNSCNVVDH